MYDQVNPALSRAIAWLVPAADAPVPSRESRGWRRDGLIELIAATTHGPAEEELAVAAHKSTAADRPSPPGFRDSKTKRRSPASRRPGRRTGATRAPKNHVASSSLS